jgi:hypothetical protein
MKVDHAPKYTRRLGNTIKHIYKLKGIRRITHMNKMHNTFAVFTREAFFDAISKQR